MANLNTTVRFLAKAERNQDVIDVTEEFRRKDNAAFFAHVAEQLAERAKANLPGGLRFDAGGVGAIGLMGEYGLIGYAIRRAQELIRVDRGPSYWSHTFLVYSALSNDATVNRSRTKSPWIWESTLEPASPFNKFIERNGVGARRLADYNRAQFGLFSEHSVPNIGVIAIALTDGEREAIVDRADDPDVDQLRYDLSGLLGTWYAYITDQADKRNPLGAGHAVYCSAYVQLAYDAAGIDLAPGAHQRNTSPEHIWQAAKVLQSAFRATDERGEQLPRPIAGWYCVRDDACVIAPATREPGPRTLRQIMKAIEGAEE